MECTLWELKARAEYMLKCEPYYMEGITEKIQCPTLVVDSEKENYFPGQAKQLYDSLKCQKELMRFTTAESAEYHCQVGAKLIQVNIFSTGLKISLNKKISIESGDGYNYEHIKKSCTK